MTIKLMDKYKFFKIVSISVLLYLTSCDKQDVFQAPNSANFQTENVIIVVIDGARYSETWGDPTHAHIPKIANEIAPYGVVSTQFFNNGKTNTNNGHSAITTGRYVEIDNSGMEYPHFPSIFQFWAASKNKPNTDAWVITSKDKLHILSDCSYPLWEGKYKPSINCGVNENGGGGYRHDSITFSKSMEILNTHHPKMTLINFREPDYSGHAANWEDYILGIENTDQYVSEIWDFIQNDSIYANKTTLIVTNDHGRHLDWVSDGFINHGDNCLGCKHLNFYAIGPDFKEGVILDNPRDLTDISATISYLLGFQIPTGRGSVMFELFK